MDTTTTDRTCVMCGAVLPRANPVGRPACYCSTTCRRAAEYGLRRVQSHLERVEMQRDSIQRSLDCGHYYPSRRAAQRELEVLDAAIARYRAELRQLIGATVGE
jgi:hypothetical protein